VKDKKVVMVCPRCKARFEKEQVIVIHKDGSTSLKQYLLKNCKECGTGLVRRVEK